MTISDGATSTAPAGANHAEGDAARPARGLVFLALAVVGLVSQIALFGAFIVENGLDPGELADQMFSSTIAALTAADLIACAIVFLVWLPGEAARSGIRRSWPFAVAVLGGLCFAFPLFLYFRERARGEVGAGVGVAS